MIDLETTYRILVPVANPSTQKGLLQLAVALAFGGGLSPIAGNRLQPAVVHPLSLIELEEYAFDSTPEEANRLIQERRHKLEELIQTLEPADVRSYVHPIVRITNTIARTTADIAELDQADLIMVGWHRPNLSKNRLGGRVGQILSTAPVDVAVFVERTGERLEKLLVPYSANIHDELALEIALRLLVNCDNCRLTVLLVVQSGQIPSDLSYEFSNVMQQLPVGVSDRIDIQTIEAAEPIQAAVKASAGVDLTIAGTSRAWGIERQTLGR